MKRLAKYFIQISNLVLLFGVIYIFFYFETSPFLHIFVLFSAGVGLMWQKSMPEILMVLLLYLGLYDLYNIRYGLEAPMSLIIIAVFLLAVLAFFIESNFNRLAKNIDKNIFLLYLIITGLVVLEIFLTMSFWPVDPKIKSLVIVVVFYLIWRIFYLYINSMLNLKKTFVCIAVSILILGGALVFNMFFGF